MLDPSLAAQLKGYLENITQPIELVATVDDRPKSAELLALLDEIAAMSDKITVRRRDDLDVRRPSFAIERVGTDISVRFAGIPLGHEFTSLVLALLQVGGHPSKAAADTIEVSPAEEKQLALRYLLDAWEEAAYEGVDRDCLATAAIFAALSELITTYGEEPVAVMCERLPERVRGGEFTIAKSRQ